MGINELLIIAGYITAGFGLGLVTSRLFIHTENNEILYLRAGYTWGKDVISSALSGTAGINKQYENGCYVLHIACIMGDIESVSQLICSGADINIQDHDERTPLMAAAMNGDYGIVTYLVQEGADVDMVDIHGMTAYELAGTKEIKEYLEIMSM